MKRLVSFLFACGLVAAVAGIQPASAQEPKQVGKFGAWTAMTFQEEGHTACYVMSEPTRKEGNYTRRGEVYLLVTHRPAQNMNGVVSFTAGYDFKPDGQVKVDIDGTGFDLFTKDDTAWARDGDDPKIVNAMVAGTTLVISGESSRGTKTVDTYSLTGFGKALQAINKACDVGG
jgi:invasion protein IalB